MASNQGVLLHVTQTETGTANGTSVNLGKSTLGAQVVFQSTTPGTASAYVKLQHSVDDSTFVDLMPFSVKYTGRQAEQVVYGGQVNQYVRASWVGASGSPPWNLSICPSTEFPAPPSNGLLLWLDAASVAATVDDGAGVATWPDRSGSGNNATQATASQAPILKLNVVNRLPVVRFDGVDDRLGVNFASPANLTAFAVVLSKSGRTGYDMIFGGASGAASLGLNTGTYELFFSKQFVAGALGTTPIAADTFKIVEVVYNATTANFFINGTADGTPALSQTFTTNIITIGDSSSSDWFLGDLAELIIYNRTLTTAERLQVERYLGRKYAITVA